MFKYVLYIRTSPWIDIHLIDNGVAGYFIGRTIRLAEFLGKLSRQVRCDFKVQRWESVSQNFPAYGKQQRIF